MESADESEPFHPFEEGRLPMSEEDLRILERNRRLTQRIMVPLMGLMGTSGIVGGFWAISTQTLAVGIGLTFSSLIMLGFAGFYYADTRKPIERREKFFVTGVITSIKRRGSEFTKVYYELILNDGNYRCFIYKEDIEKVKPGDIVQCERLEENSVYADRVTVMTRVK